MMMLSDGHDYNDNGHDSDDNDKMVMMMEYR